MLHFLNFSISISKFYLQSTLSLTSPPTNMPLLPNAIDSRVAVVTGGLRGFGASIVQRFVSEGCKVIVLDLDVGEETENTHYQKADVTKRESWEEALTYAKTTYGRLDIVVNNAGITFDNAPIHTKTMEEYDKTFNVNVRVSIASSVPSSY